MNLITNLTIRRNRLKAYEAANTYSTGLASYFLNDGDEFEIEFLNHDTVSYLAKISLNGISISTRGLVIKPGEHIFLDRYIDSDNRFKFSTYEVEDTEEIKKAIANNGLLEIDVYKETVPAKPFVYELYKSYQPYIYTSPIGYDDWGNIMTITDCNTFSTLDNTYVDNKSVKRSAKRAAPKLGDIVTTYTTLAMCSMPSEKLSSAIIPVMSTLETGRVEKGGSTGRHLINDYTEFETWTCKTIKYKLLSMSEKPITVSEVRKSYCPGCGARRKKFIWTHCPYCGEKY